MTVFVTIESTNFITMTNIGIEPLPPLRKACQKINKITQNTILSIVANQSYPLIRVKKSKFTTSRLCIIDCQLLIFKMIVTISFGLYLLYLNL